MNHEILSLTRDHNNIRLPIAIASPTIFLGHNRYKNVFFDLLSQQPYRYVEFEVPTRGPH